MNRARQSMLVMMCKVADAFARLIERAATRPPYEVWHPTQDRLRLVLHPDESLALIPDALAHPAPHVRRYFARLARDVDRTRARDLLRPLLADPDEEVRVEACGGVFGEPAWYPDRATATPLPAPTGALRDELIAALADLLRSSRLVSAEMAIDMLVALGDPALGDRLRARLPCHDWNIRSRIFGGIERCAQAVPLLAELATHPDAQTRCAALYGIARIPALAELALRALADPDPSVRDAAAFACGRHGLHAAEPHLLAQTSWTRTVIDALAALRSQAALPRLIALARAAGDDLQEPAVAALGRLVPSRAIEDVLLDLLVHCDEPYAKKAAAFALEEVGTVRVVPALERYAKRGTRGLAKRSRKDVWRRMPRIIERVRERPTFPEP